MNRTGGKLLRCLQVAPSCGENAASCFSAALPSGPGRLEVPPGSGGGPSEDLEWRDSSDVSGQDRMLKHFGERRGWLDLMQGSANHGWGVWPYELRWVLVFIFIIFSRG
ncbi:unnamed protein product [Rangifer tarandus platyrhynchus]|uniref:Uncharacterized protein n=1 Tax=Rangifer tarandus platyrhynchus TaxID=3082113 RepID=A0AC59YH54_RANTA